MLRRSPMDRLKREAEAREAKGAGEKLQIRPMAERDLPQICEIEQEAFSTPWSEKGFRDSLALPYAVFLAAEYEGEIAGYCGCYLSQEEAEITNVAVKQGLRGRGIAKALIRELFRTGRTRGALVFLLEVRAGNQPAICLYEGLGFERAGLRRNFYEKPKEDAVVMWKRFPDS